ncbi:collagen alpha-1(XII) chain-like [Lineus longissimus]|uniref:collagen alpha-1(XII) chain-like n=1 Tax=Lineus longissimus TaxID=88925 RepID=UPI00315D448D
MPGPIEACRVQKSDILFVLDASTSISMEKFDAMRSFVKRVVNTELIDILGRDHTQVGLVSFSTNVTLNIPYDKFYNTEDFNKALADLTYDRGDTYLGKALRFVRTKVLRPKNGYRPTVPQMLIILTDGWESDPGFAKDEIKRLKEMGVHTIAVGIGYYVDKAGLKQLVKSSDAVEVEAWKGLKDKLPQLRKDLCKEVQVIKRCDKHFESNVILVVDCSTSIGLANFQRLREFLINVVNSFKVIGEDGIQVGMMQYSSYTKTKVVFQLDTYNTRQQLEAAIKKLVWKKGATKTGYAMMMAESKIARKAKRKTVQTTFIVVTDGNANDKVEVAAARLHAMNYTVLAVGIGKDVDSKELRVIASKPKEVHVFHPEDFNELQYFMRYVVTEVCHPSNVLSEQQKEENKAEEEESKY